MGEAFSSVDEITLISEPLQTRDKGYIGKSKSTTSKDGGIQCLDVNTPGGAFVRWK